MVAVNACNEVAFFICCMIIQSPHKPKIQITLTLIEGFYFQGKMINQKTLGNYECELVSHY